MLAFVVIATLYASIGLLAAAGTILLAGRVLAPRAERIFYAILLVMIAAFYLVFTAYFDAAAAWGLEAAAVVVFAAIGLLGLRLPAALAVGFALHGVWDLLHELHAHGADSAFGPGRLTDIPLAYGALCAAFDFAIAAYVYPRRGALRDSAGSPGAS